MASLALALALFLQGQPAAEAAPPPEVPAEERLPAGAPKDDYQFVGWCYGMLRGYLDLHDQVMPEVTRIETAFRPPDRKLSDDLKVYADMQKDGQKQLKVFQAALTAAEKASLRPINILGAKAVAQGADVWKAASDVTPARLAQEWMSWALPARCEVTAKSLKANATLMGGAFKVNAEPEAAPAEKPVETKEAAAAEAPPPEAKPAGDAPAASGDAAPPAEAGANAKPTDPAAVLLDADAPPPAKAPAKRKAAAKGKAVKKAKAPPPAAAPEAPPEPAPEPTPTPQ